MVRIKQEGPIADGKHFYMSISGFEIYGDIVGSCKRAFDKHIQQELMQKQARRACMQRAAQIIRPGSRVRRGADWKWGNQDGDPPGIV